MSERFDDLARAIASGEEVGRRRLLRRALAAVGLGVGVAAVSERPAGAVKPVNCPPGLENCGGLCRDTSAHPDHCGACGNVCGDDSVCRHGTCVKVVVDSGSGGCPSGLTACGGACVNVQTDNGNCGTCGHVCPAGTTCSNGACVTTSGGCPPGQAACAPGQCIDLTNDVQNCGACGNVCSSNHATSACVNGTCQIGTCAPGWADCDRNAATGCETNIASDIANCGACGNVCPPNSVCNNGTCVTA
jgi:hypothetical protein